MDLNRIQSAQPAVLCDGLTQEVAIITTLPTGTEAALVVRDAVKGQQTSANSRPVVIASDQSDIGVNLDKVGGAAITLGQKVMASSIPITIASDQTDLGINIDKYGGTATTLGTKVAASSIPVTLASDQPDIGINLDKVGGSVITLGQKVMASSVPVVISSDQSDIGVNIDKYGGTATTLGQKVMASSVPVTLASDQSAITVSQATAANLNATVVGTKTNNNAAPGANNIGTLPAVATTAAPSYTTGDQVALSTDLSGNLRTTGTATIAGLDSTNNSSTANLGSNGVFTGTGDDTTNYNTVNVQVFANQASAAGGLSLQFSTDNTNWDFATTYTITASTVFTIELAPQGRYFRIVYTNGAVAQTTFRLQTVLRTTEASPTAAPAGSQPTGSTTPGALYIQGVTGMNPVSDNLTQIAGNAVATAASGIIKVGLTDAAGTSITLGQKVMASSVPVTIASDQTDLGVNIDKYGGTATTLGTKVAASSIPVTMASDQPDIGINIDKYGGTATTLGQKVMASSIPVTLASDQSAITVSQATAANLNATVVGTLTNNNAAPGANNVGVLPARANAAAPTWTEGDQVLLSEDLSGNLRAAVQGNVASGTTDAGNPVKIGAVGHTAQPTAVTDGQRVDVIADKIGRLVTTYGQVRDLKTNNRTSISNTTETTVLAAVAATFLDLTQIIITNSDKNKDANVDFRDSTGGTIRVTIHAPALATVAVNFADILTQASVNNNWTATSDSSSATLAITVLAIKNI